jgi:hypothetical protein
VREAAVAQVETELLGAPRPTPSTSE